MATAPLDQAAADHAQDQQAAADLVIKCVGLTKIFRDFWLRNRVRAVDGIDLDVRRGEVFGLLGPNGSGKSTTIKMILGLLHPTRGRIAVFGQHPRNTAIKNRIGYLPEESYLYRFLDARETLDYYGRLFHQDRRTRHRRTEMLLEMVGLDRVASRPVGEYSKGMQRRIGIAQALINDPELLILDEPTTGLDPIGTRQVKDLILELKDRGKTILLCSHLLADVEDVTDRVAIMYGGKIRRGGDIDELLQEKSHTTVTLPALDEQAKLRVMDALERIGITDGRFDTPRQKLEPFFLNLVAEAQRTGVATSGAGNAGQIAEFLRSEHEQTPQTGEAVIESLVSTKRPEPKSAEAAPAQPSPTAADDVVDKLTKVTRPKPSEPAPPTTTTGDDQEDRGVIDDLLGH